SFARAASSSFLTLGTVFIQRGRTPQFVFIRSRTKSAVVLVSTFTGLSSGTGGGFTVAHSVVMSLACTGHVESVAKMARSAAARQQHSARYSMMPSRIRGGNRRRCQVSEDHHIAFLGFTSMPSKRLVVLGIVLTIGKSPGGDYSLLGCQQLARRC